VDCVLESEDIMSDTSVTISKKERNISIVKKMLPLAAAGLLVQLLICAIIVLEAYLLSKIGVSTVITAASILCTGMAFSIYVFYSTVYTVYKSFTDIYSNVEGTKFNNKISEVNIESMIVTHLAEISRKLDGTVIATYENSSSSKEVN